LISAFLTVGGSSNIAVINGATTTALNANTSGTVVPLNAFSSSNPVNPNNSVKAGIAYILFDEQFKYAGSGFDPVDASSSGGLKSHVLPPINVPKNGYIYVYCSNESNIDVFFDNLEVIDLKGPILEETHYYPFGLTMAGISSKAALGLENRYKFNAGTELQSGEFSDGSGLELYATNYRSLDPQIGRFWQVDPLAEINYDNSPYAFASNNPILINDPTGLTDSVHKEVSTPKNPTVLDEIVVPGKKNSSNSGVDSWITALGWGGLGIDSYENLLYKGDYMYKTSKGVVQSIFDTKWGANKTADELGNILNYSKNAQAAIRV
jgi:RHS repeat-associated protein